MNKYWNSMNYTGVLLLEDGSIFYAYSFGAKSPELARGKVGELVFHTGMSGYQEILTDPSYCGQIVAMTYPQIGNYGINTQDLEAGSPFLSGLVVHEASLAFSNWRSSSSLESYLKKHNIPALTGVNTRSLTRHIREKGSINAYILSPIPKTKREIEELLGFLKKEASFDTQDLVSKVTCTSPYEWEETCSSWQKQWRGKEQLSTTKSQRIAVLDFGCKRNSLRHFHHRSCKVKVFPAHTKAEEILSFSPNGLFLSNGPGNPQKLQYAVQTVQALLGKLPIFGICMGHQVLSMAIGAETFKLKFGHHGANQPVFDLKSKKVIITSQNHNYAVNSETLPSYARVSHINLNDKTVEGISLPEHRAFSVQYHPEACPGPRDAEEHFDQFLSML